MRCEIYRFTTPFTGVWLYITNFNQFSAVDNIIIQFSHKTAAVDPSTSFYLAEFYVWAS